MEFIPDAHITEVFGLLEILDDNGGSLPADDIQKISGVVFDELLPVIDAAEMLGLVVVNKNMVKLTKFGKKIVGLEIEERQDEIAKRIKNTEIFKKVLSMIKRKGAITMEELISFLEKELTKRDAKKEARKIIEWGRYAELISYDIEDRTITLQE